MPAVSFALNQRPSVPEGGPERDTFLPEQLRAVVAGDPAAIRAFLVLVAPVVSRAVRRVLGGQHPDVEDVAQQALSGLMERLPSFRGDSSVAHFAQRVAVYRALTARRDARVRAGFVIAAEPSALAQAADAGPGPLGAVIEASRRALLLEALDGLPPAQAEALTLHFLFDHTVGEIAGVMEVSAETVRSRLRLGKQALRLHILRESRFAALGEELVP
jgi:RNA polymerase sigma factor (sigma-70 family)